MSQPDVVKLQRRHDLDALRAFAMLLGIVLHVGSAFTPAGVFGRGSPSAPWFAHTLGLIHGFRMQLFFVISGFFTMMLLRRRGTWAVSRQRALRIALPLLLGMFTIIPAAEWASKWARQRQQTARPATAAPTLATAVQSHDGNAIYALANDPAQLDRPDPVRGVTPLAWAVLNNDLPTARLLLDRGARAIRPSRGGNTPLHYAALLGRRDLAELLLKRGAPPSAKNAAGQIPAAMADFPWDETRYALYTSGGRAGDRTTVEAGRQQVKQLLDQFVPPSAPAPARVPQAAKPAQPVTRPAALPQTRPVAPTTRAAVTRPAPKIATATSQPTRAPATAPLAQAAGIARPATRPTTRPQTQPVAAIKPPAPPAPRPPAQPPTPDLPQRYLKFLTSPTFRIWVNDEPIQLFNAPAFRHLWFLWFVCWLTPALFLAVCLTDALSLRIPRSLVISPLCLLWLIPLTLLPQWFMRHPAYLFGPETSSGWIPVPHVLLFYAIFFGFGAMCYAYGGFGSATAADPSGAGMPTSRWRDVTRWWWLALPLALGLAYPLGQAYSKDRTALSIAITIYGWLMIFGLIGLFRALLKREHKAIRYLSDASYWLYLTHIAPIPIAQLLLRESPVAAPWKFLIICATITLGLLIVYDILVRYTFIGAMLNGRKTRPPLFRRSPPPGPPISRLAQPAENVSDGLAKPS